MIPLVMKRTVGLHPIFVIFAMLAGAQIAGFIGVILAVPTAVIIQEIIEDRAAKKRDKQKLNSKCLKKVLYYHSRLLC